MHAHGENIKPNAHAYTWHSVVIFWFVEECSTSRGPFLNPTDFCSDQNNNGLSSNPSAVTPQRNCLESFCIRTDHRSGLLEAGGQHASENTHGTGAYPIFLDYETTMAHLILACHRSSSDLDTFFQVFTDYRNARFENSTRYVNKNHAIDLIAEVPPKECTERVVFCDGGGGPLGHPKVYINLVCPCCSGVTFN